MRTPATARARLAGAVICAVICAVTAATAAACAGPASQHATRPSSAASDGRGAGVARASRVRGVLTDASAGTARLGSALPAPPPIESDEYDYCENEDSGAYPSPQHNAISISIAGYADASKLNEGAAAGVPVPAVAAGGAPDEGVDIGGASQAEQTASGGKGFDCDLITTQLNYQGLREFPPLQATFLAYGFMPVTATAYLTQVGPDPVTAVAITKIHDACPGGCAPGVLGPLVAGEPLEVVATTEVELRLADVEVNGAPLDVGSGCQTDGPLETTQSPVPGESFPGELALYGGASETGDPTPEWTGYLEGGALAGSATIPPFINCTSPDGENLDPLISSAVSGPGNYIKVETSAACYLGAAPECASAPGGGTVNTPTVTPYWTVDNGGDADFAGHMTSDSLTISDGETHLKDSVIACSDAGMTGTMPEAEGPPRGNPGTATLSFGATCQGQQGLAGSSWQVTEQGTVALSPITYLVVPGSGFDPGDVWLKVTDLTLTLSGTNVPGAPDGNCTVDVSGRSTMEYTQPQPGTGSAPPALQWNATFSQFLELIVDSSGCTHSLSISGPGFNPGDNINLTGSYNVYQACNQAEPEECQPAAITFTNPSLSGS
jgi:hypothetical protein